MELFLSLFQLIMTTGHHKIKARALSQDENANFVLAFSVLASILTLIAIAFELGSAKQAYGMSKSVHLILPAITLIGAWSLLPTMFSIHYAHLFFSIKIPLKNQFIFQTIRLILIILIFYIFQLTSP